MTTERDRIAQAVLSSGVDLMEDGVGDAEENAYRIADTVLAAQPLDPGAPQTDETARNAARNGIRDHLAWGDDTGLIADRVVEAFTVTWERAVNAHGRSVRRYVLRGAWEVDPEAPPSKLREAYVPIRPAVPPS